MTPGSRPSRSGRPASRDDLLHRNLDLLAVHRILPAAYRISSPSLAKQSTTGTHWDLLDLEYMRRYVSAAQRCPDGSADCLLERRVQLVPCAHLDEQQHTLVFILRPALAHTYRVVDACGKHRTLEHAVDLARTEAHARRDSTRRRCDNSAARMSAQG
jgi:hypothetical protein